MAIVWLRTSLNVTAAPPRAGSLHGVHPLPPIIPEHQRRLHARSFPCLVHPAELQQEKESIILKEGETLVAVVEMKKGKCFLSASMPGIVQTERQRRKALLIII